MNHCDIINHFTSYIFTKNQKNQQILFGNDIYSFFGINNNKDLFKFIFEIFYRGIVLLYGTNNKMKLNDLTESQLDHIKNRFRYANIKFIIRIYDVDTANIIELIDKNNLNEYNVVKKSLDDIELMADDKDLKEYIFNMYMNNMVYSISFDIF